MDIHNVNKEVIDIFKNAYKDASYQKTISEVYQSLQNVQGHNTLHVKERWESEGNLLITEK